MGALVFIRVQQSCFEGLFYIEQHRDKGDFMSTVFSGEQGPFVKGTQGYYGRNAAYNVQLARIYDPLKVDQATIRYTPETSPRFAEDSFGYARQDINPLDGDQDGRLSRDELVKAFGGEKPMADAFMKVLDTNDDGQIDRREMAAYVLFQDHSAGLVQGAAEAMAEANLLPAAQQAQLEKSFKGPDGEPLTSKADGQITPFERAFAEMAVVNLPTLTRTVLTEIDAALPAKP
jgi:Ca2+-binding EF-hand superfamily protein